MAPYTPEFVAAVRHDYLYSDKTRAQIALEHGIGDRDIGRLRESEGWPLRSARIRSVPRAVQALQELQALAETVGRAKPVFAHAETSMPATEQPDDNHAGLTRTAQSADPDVPLPVLPATAETSAIERIARIERLIEQELAAEETMRAQLGREPRSRADAERCARTLATLTQTLHGLARLRGGHAPEQETEHDDMPHDIDDFRNELARRIRAFVQSRTGDGVCEPVGEADGEAGV